MAIMLLRFIIICALAAQSNAYAIDTTSCTGASFTLLDQNIPCAFDMAQNALNAVLGPIQPPVQTLMDALWASGPASAGTPIVSPQMAVIGRFGGTPLAGITQSMFGWDTFYFKPYGGFSIASRGIVSMSGRVPNTKVDGETTVGAADVIFYCGTARYIDIVDQDGNKRIKDTDINELVNQRDSDPRKDCLSALAFTMVPDDPTKPTVINICPWFIQYISGLKNPTCTSWKTKLGAILAKPAVKFSTKVWPYTQMDLLSLFDKVVVHELTHTRHGGQTFDCTLDGTDNAGWFYRNTGYGWKNCNKMSTRRPDDSAYKTTQKPIHNADSYGLFASGVRIIQAGGSINPDGSVIGPSRRAKRGQVEEELSTSHVEAPGLWSTEFNSTFFPENTEMVLNEAQKRVLVAALMGEFHAHQRAHEHDYSF